MKIEKKYQLHEITKRADRELLEHFLVSRTLHFNQYIHRYYESYPNQIAMPMPTAFHNGIAIATDGFVLAIVPIELDKDDKTGILYGDILRTAKAATPGKRDIILKLDKDNVTIPITQSTHIRKNEFITLSYPDIRAVVSNARANFVVENLNKRVLVFDQTRLNVLCKALGIQVTGKTNAHNRKARCFLYPLSDDEDGGVLLISNKEIDEGKQITPPFGLLMEMHKRK